MQRNSLGFRNLSLPWQAIARGCKPSLTGWWGDFLGLLLVALQGTFTWGLISFQPCNLGKNRDQWARANIGEAPCQGKAGWSQHHQELARPCIRATYPALQNLKKKILFYFAGNLQVPYKAQSSVEHQRFIVWSIIFTVTKDVLICQVISLD